MNDNVWKYNLLIQVRGEIVIVSIFTQLWRINSQFLLSTFDSVIEFTEIQNGEDA